MKKVLYFCGTYCPSTGGAEISAHNILKELRQEFGVDSLVLTDERFVNQSVNSKFEKIKMVGTNYDQRKEKLKETINSYKPDVILTQLLWSDVGLEIANEEHIKSILRVCKTPFQLDISKGSKYEPTNIISVSEYTKEYLKLEHSRDSFVTNPSIDADRAYSPGYKYDNNYILMFNNLVRKGAKIFAEIATKLPNREFAVVPGWNILKNSENFDPKIIGQLCESLRTPYNGQVPEMFSDFPKNVHILEPDFNVANIYAKTRLVCIPSLWDETFGRVALESFANGIPVLGSAVGGLQEQVQQGGVLILDYKNSESWVKSINLLDDKLEYDKQVQRGYQFIENKHNQRDILNLIRNLL